MSIEDPPARPGPVRFGVVGHGWRADFYLRLARLAPDRFQCVGAVTRRAEVGERLEREWNIPTYRTPEELVSSGAPEVVVTSVPREANPDVIRALVGLDTAVLSETPPAADADGMRRLWVDVGARDLVQVAEQHPYLPVVVAVRALIDQGVLGDVTSAQVSWTHDYHAMALLRTLLSVRAEPARISAMETATPVLEGPDRGGWPDVQRVRDAAHTLSILDFGGRTGVYDFTEGQWFHPWRRRHLTLRGSRGEVVGNDVIWAGDDGRPLSAPIVRRHTGFDGNLEGAELDALSWCGRTLYRNPYPGSRMSDEEIAIATCLERTALWRRGAESAPYPLADGCQDHLLALGVHAAAERGEPVTTGDEPWAGAIQGAQK
ncbi:Gfo/Idh/MocA family protein [Planosporangium sp. 12N6]|uniref:Gfo/Idh/MocA family protein n=1 Tax=Planosporangium spinosum TaxID=3402278 RepID=UPI003CE76F4F